MQLDKYTKVLLTLLIVWLFFNTLVRVSQQNTKLDEIEKEKLSIEKKKLDAQEQYVIFSSNGAISVPIMYNKVTGESFKFFMNTEGDKSIGWVPLLYTGFGQHGVTPKIWRDNFIASLGEQEKKN
ncbi:MAG: hypothetical protein PHI59_08540 [Candidatus Omnitrophica bacterium]|nr:hypothetical protein [Candidatus Omnitrophota bacterium]